MKNVDDRKDLYMKPNRESYISPDHEYLQYSGRIDTTNPKQPILIYPSSSVTFRFHGTKVGVKITNIHGYWNNYLGVIIDGRQTKQILGNELTEYITLAENLRFGEHTVQLFKRMDGCHEFLLHYITLGHGGYLLPPPKQPLRKIEIYGDSVSAGEVSEASGYEGQPDPIHEGEYSNSWYSYGWITARKLNARLHNISQGGIALMDGTGWFHAPDYIGMESAWDKIRYNPELGPVLSWEFKNYTPHVVIVAIGQNDNHPEDIMEMEKTMKIAYWKIHYKKFITQIRTKYPHALIILATTILEHHQGWDLAIQDVCRALGDKKIVYFAYSRTGRGTKGHIRIIEAEEMADEMTSFIKGFGEEIWAESY